MGKAEAVADIEAKGLRPNLIDWGALLAPDGICEGVFVVDCLVGAQGEDECLWVQEILHFRARDAAVPSENVSLAVLRNKQDVSAGRADFL